jgi:hypothetical protein
MIVKAFIGKHIDLDKVVSISDARFINLMGSGGYFVGFEIYIQLLDKPIKYMREFDRDEVSWENKVIDNKTYPSVPRPVTVSGSDRDSHYYTDGKLDFDILAVQRLQAQIDELVEQWKECKQCTK